MFVEEKAPKGLYCMLLYSTVNKNSMPMSIGLKNIIYALIWYHVLKYTSNFVGTILFILLCFISYFSNALINIGD